MIVQPLRIELLIKDGTRQLGSRALKILTHSSVKNPQLNYRSKRSQNIDLQDSQDTIQHSF